MGHYTHLSMEERESILGYRAQGKSVREVAKQMERSPATISRELRRNREEGKRYSPSRAQRKYEQRRRNCRRPCKLADPWLREKVMCLWLKKHWSPEQISNRLRLEGGEAQISCKTIYRGIYAHLLEEHKLAKDERGVVLRLRHKGRPRGRKGPDNLQGRLKISNHISQRTLPAQERTQAGHWEADTVAGKLNTGRIVALVDRKTRFALAGKVERKEADLVADVMISLLSTLPAHLVLSITPDLGKEFFAYQKVSDALHHVPFYFPDPGSPWQRATCENFNGLLREFFPKRTSFAHISDQSIQTAIFLLNTRPRKVLGWLSPLEALFASLLLFT